MYQEQGAEFVPQYLNLLAAGGSRPPQEILEGVNVDMTSESFWQSGFEAISGMVTQLEHTLS
jgi:oligoendopeptidase F